MKELTNIYLIASAILLFMFIKLCINVGITRRSSEKQAFLLKKIFEQSGGELSDSDKKFYNL